MDTRKIFYFCRHGQTDHNAKRLLQGSGVFSELNETGKQQAASLARRFHGEEIDLVISSPLERAKMTAEAVVLSHQRQPPLKLNDHLVEVSWGDWEGKDMREEVVALSKRWSQGHFDESAPNGESLRQVRARAHTALESLKNESASRIVVVAHGRLLSVLLSLMTPDGSGPRGLKNTSVTVVEYTPEGNKFDFIVVDCLRHLEPSKH